MCPQKALRLTTPLLYTCTCMTALCKCYSRPFAAALLLCTYQKILVQERTLRLLLVITSPWLVSQPTQTPTRTNHGA
ncbi:hypothetical protein K504DRAFT_307572 [Pleomassaria siparia CBS 279.74]|uniref:Uncharacterized protein n=1 Tax=Pleomassaria siparia CBS 279.74 TaxID=1314801 RepID=A0A6G1K7N7_9PLEO|nr:hypothetical protein K504DRAFT_307572 [Pleomassaria siparia CBS 279.74]